VNTSSGRCCASDQLLEGVFLVAMRATEIAVKARGMTTGVRQLMKGRPMPIDRLEVGGEWRHPHIIFCRHIEGAVAADAKVDAGRLDQVLHPRSYSAVEAAPWSRSPQASRHTDRR